MSRWTFILIVFCMVVTTTGRTFVAMAGDPNDCIQQNYIQVCPLDLDPNLVSIGPILYPSSYDPNDPNSLESWTVDYGKYNQRFALCDPDGDPMVVEVRATNTIGAEVVFGDARDATNVMLVAECRPGLAWWHLRVTDAPADVNNKSQDVVVVANVRDRENHAPVLNPY